MNKLDKSVPDLRFPEFKEGWTEKRLRESISEFKEKSNQNNQHIVLTSSNKGLMKQSDYYGENRITERENLGFNIIPDGYITYRSRSDDRKFTFNINCLGTTGIISIYYPVFTIKQGSNKFFVEYFNYRQHYLGRYSVGTSQQVLSINDLRSVKLFIPSNEEQQKIAAFLTAIDEKIQQLSKKKHLLKQYKKGVMQQIFNQEIRFKDDNGKDFADWTEKKFGEVFTFRITNSYSRDNLNYNEGKVKNIHYGDIHTKFNSLFDITKEYVPFINSEISLKKIAEDNYCKKGDLIIADASEDYADVGKCIEITNLNNEKVVAGLHTFLARPDLYKMEVGFSGYLMQSREVRLQIMTIAQGTKVLSISTGRLSNVKLNIPSNEEQQKIAVFLSAIDEKINLVDLELEKTQIYKKGLLQQMFI